MTDGVGNGGWVQRGILVGACAVVFGIYVCAAHSGTPLSGKMGAADNYYNLLVEGFRAGQLSLKKEVPPALAQLADPYDPKAHTSYQEVGDTSYYHGKLYLYFGVTPAVLLFWPYAALTGHYLLQRDAVVIFCLVGFLASVGLLWALWRRYFAEVGVAVVAALALALGLAAGMPIMLERSDVYEVPISCGYALSMLALAAIWRALHQSRKRSGYRWLAAASLAFGLAVGARPLLLFGAVILLVPVAQAWRERKTVLVPLLAAAVPITLIGLGLMLHNFLRFDNPLEFGWRYQLAGMRQDTGSPFHLRYLWYNLRLYFLEPVRWSRRFPFVQDILVPPEPAGHVGGLERTFGVLTNIPLVWLALAVPLGWRGRAEHTQGRTRNGFGASLSHPLGGFLAAVAVLFGVGSLTISLLAFAEGRYEMEFLPALVLLAVIGVLSLDHALTGKPLWRGAARLGWCLLLAFSVAFNLLVSVKLCAEWHNDRGVMLVGHGKVQEAIGHFEQALRLSPDYVLAHKNLGADLARQGRVHEAIEQYEQALRIRPDDAEAHYDLAVALTGQGKVQEAIGHYEQALRVKPDDPEAHYNLGVALDQLGKLQDAIDQYQQAVHFNPDLPDVHNNLGASLARQGRVREAIDQYEQALRIRPDYAVAHYNLGLVLEQAGHTQEAIQQYEQALRLNPDDAVAHNNLGIALIQLGRPQEAMEQWEQALRIKTDYADAHYNLGVALEKLGRTQEAIQQYEKALHIQPDFVEARDALARARGAQ